MSTLIVGLHILWTPAREASFRRSLPPGEYKFLSVVVGQGGTAYEFYARALRERNTGIWRGVMKELRGADYTNVLLVSWSAGYGFVRELAKELGGNLPSNLVGYVALDSIYGGKKGDVPDPKDVAPWIPWAQAAREGRFAFILACSEVETPYASTREMGRALCLAVGQPLEDIPQEGLRGYPRYAAVGAYGKFVVLFVDTAPGKGGAEHVGALDLCGPAFVSTAYTLLPPELPKSRARLIDVSHHQATLAERKSRAPAVNGAAARDVGVSGIAARALYGGTEDETFRATWDACGKEGLVRGAYAFILPAGFQGAPTLIDQAKQLGTMLGKLDEASFIALDVEPPPGITTLQWSFLISEAELVAWSDTIRELTGKMHVTYTARWSWFWKFCLSKSPLWLPYYRTPRSETPWPSGKELPVGWDKAVMYQWTERFQYPNEGPLDGDLYDGTEAELRAFVRNL